MIDVIKRLAQLDAVNPAIDTGAAVVKPEQGVVAECGPMGMMDGMSQPHTPASINMTAATGDELSGMLKDIMSLAGLSKADDSGMDQLGIDTEPMAALTAEPEMGPDAGAGPGATDGEVMRSVLDKLNPDDEEENPFGSNNNQGGDDGVSQAHGDIDGDGDHDMADHDAEKSEPEADKNPFGGNQGDSEEDDKEETDETYDGPQYSTTPNDPNKDRQGYAQNGIGPAKDENSGDGKGRHTAQPQGKPSAFEGLMKEYKSFIGESEEEVEEEEDMEEGIEDRLKDLDPKNPVNQPAYQRKAASGDSASAANTAKESANESMATMLRLAGLTK